MCIERKAQVQKPYQYTKLWLQKDHNLRNKAREPIQEKGFDMSLYATEGNTTYYALELDFKVPS